VRLSFAVAMRRAKGHIGFHGQRAPEARRARPGVAGIGGPIALSRQNAGLSPCCRRIRGAAH
jgi:hypothetical protein